MTEGNFVGGNVTVLRNNPLFGCMCCLAQCCSATTGALKLGRVYVGHQHAAGLVFPLLFPSSVLNRRIFTKAQLFQHVSRACVLVCVP